MKEFMRYFMKLLQIIVWMFNGAAIAYRAMGYIDYPLWLGYLILAVVIFPLGLAESYFEDK